MNGRVTTLQSANSIFPKILFNGETQVVDELPGEIPQGYLLIEATEEFPIGESVFYVQTTKGTIVVKSHMVENELTITVYATWASHSGSSIDGTRDFNGVVEVPAGTALFESVFYTLPSYVNLGYNWITPVDFGDYFVIHSANANSEPVKILKTGASHEFFSGFPEINPRAYPIVNRDIEGIVSISDHGDVYGVEFSLVYINTDTGSFDLYDLSGLPEALPDSPNNITNSCFIYLGARRFAYYPQHTLTGNAYIFEISETGTIELLGAKDWSALSDYYIWPAGWYQESNFLRRDNEIFISGFTYNGGILENEELHQLAKFDWSGNLLWVSEYPPDMDGFGNVYPQPMGFLPNGNVVYVYTPGFDLNYYVVEINSLTGVLVGQYDTGVEYWGAPPGKLLTVIDNDIYVKDYYTVFKYNYSTQLSTTVVSELAHDGYIQSATMADAIDSDGNIFMISRSNFSGSGISVIRGSDYETLHLDSIYDFDIWDGGIALADGKIYVVDDSPPSAKLIEFFLPPP